MGYHARYIVIMAVMFVLCIAVDTFALKTIKNPFATHPPHRQKLSDRFSDLSSLVTLSRVTGDTTLTASNHKVMVDTDGGVVTITLPAGVTGKEYVLFNVGSSGKNMTITPNGTETLLGANSNFQVRDGEVEVITFDPIEGWR